jgi:DNA-binding MurR/RpiR family transcriptional regulator
MNKRGPTTSTLDLVAAVSNQLTPTERRVAEAVLAEPTLLAFGTVSDLAGRVGTSRPSIVRFATKLGFGGYTELQQHVRRDLSHRLSRPSERIRSDGETVVPARVAINDAISSVFDALDGDRLAELAQPVARAEKVWILSGETSQAGAHALHSGLSMVRPGVRALEEHSYATDLSDEMLPWCSTSSGTENKSQPRHTSSSTPELPSWRSLIVRYHLWSSWPIPGFRSKCPLSVRLIVRCPL